MAKLDVGKTLYNARTSKGIILEEVEKATHIRLNYLLAIEENRFHEIPALAYVRAYVRKYAEFLGLDPAPLLSSIEDTVPASYLLDLPSPPQKERLFYRRKNPLRSFLLISGAALLCFLLILVFLDLILPKGNLETTVTPSASPSEISPLPPSTSVSTTKPSEVVTTPTLSSQPTPPGKIVQLQVQAVNQGTIEVIIDGRVQFQGELSPGQKGTWRGESFTLHFDDPQNFKIFIEDQEISPGPDTTFQWP